MKKKHEHIIESVRPGSIAEELGIEPGDVLLEIDGQVIEDIFDYQFYVESACYDPKSERGRMGA